MTMYARACEFLHKALAAGPRPRAGVIAAAEQAGINYGAVLLAARSLVRGGDWWQLAPARSPADHPAD